MSVSVLIYVGTVAFTVMMCLWAFVGAMFGESDSRTHRCVTASCALGSLLATATLALAPSSGHPRLVWTSALLPLFVLGTAWSNVVTMRTATLSARILAAPIIVYDLLLLGVSSAWFAQECLGLDLGTWGWTLISAQAQTQTLIGHPTASENPSFLQLPIALPVWYGLRFFEFGALTASCVISTLMLFVYFLVMPLSFKRTESFREVRPPTLTYRCATGVGVPWGEQVLNETQRTRIRLHLQQLGAKHVAFSVDTQTFEDKALLRQVVDETRWAKSAGLETVVRVLPPPRYSRIPAASLQDLCEELGRTQTLAARHLAPGVLVMLSGPFGTLRRYVAASSTPAQWLQAIRNTARELRLASRHTLLSVAVETFGAEGDELFRLLDTADSPIDVIGIGILPRGRLRTDIDKDIEQLANWCRQNAGHRPLMVTECRCSPQLLGGELGQWNLFSRLIELGDLSDMMRAVCFDSLYDMQRNVGLISWAGRRRMSYRMLQDAAARAPARPAK